MKRRFFLILGLINLSSLFANMAYMGPQDAHVSGQQLVQNVRITHELLTADLRKLPGGIISVFADYRLLCTKDAGKIRFLFVASSAQPVNLEIILDGKVIACKPVISDYREAGFIAEGKINRDSMSEVIGFDLRGEDYHYQHLLDQLFVFDVEMTQGSHQLKIGYTCTPTGYEKENLRYTTFPYFLGNTHTRNLYDSIFVKILLPENVEYECNFAAQKKQNTLFSANIAGFKKSHIVVSIYKNVEKELAIGWNIFTASQILLWIVVLVLTLFYLRRRKDKNKPFLVSLLTVMPVSLVVGFVFYFCMVYYYQFYEDKYGVFLKGNWGKGYLFLIVPVVVIFSGIIWVILAFIYNYLIYGRKWDPTSWFNRKGKYSH